MPVPSPSGAPTPDPAPEGMGIYTKHERSGGKEPTSWAKH
jgi:hypothetical protein